MKATLTLLSVLLLTSPVLGATEDARPNIVFFLVDDQRNDTLGCAGHPIIQTPTIDRLATEGVRMENAFVTTSICAASRASIFTGLVESTHGYTFRKPPVPERFAHSIYPMLLRRAGYRTGYFGKYGVQMKVDPNEAFDGFASRDRPYLRGGRHIDMINTEQALAFLDDCTPDQPFCLQVSFSSAHAEDRDRTPGRRGHYPVIDPVRQMYTDVDVPRPRLDDPAIFQALPEFLRTSMNRNRFHWRWDTPEKYQKNMRAYFAMISGVDHMIGQVVDRLRQRGFDENTVIIYLGDNGYYMGDRGFAGKWSHFEQSLRVPLIIRDPRASREHTGRVLAPMALNIDVPATILDLAGVPVPKHYQGRSLAAFVRGEQPENWREDFFCEHRMEHRAIPKWEGVRGERYKYARYIGQEPPYEFLHDLRDDPDELKNLAGDAASAEVLEQMRARCDELSRRYTEARGG